MRLRPGGGSLESHPGPENSGGGSCCERLPGILQEPPKAGRGLAKAFRSMKGLCLRPWPWAWPLPLRKNSLKIGLYIKQGREGQN